MEQSIKQTPMNDDDLFRRDEAKYREMSVPFESSSDGMNAVEAFCKKVKELREAYRIAEVVVIAGVYVADEEDKEKGQLRMMTAAVNYGDFCKAFTLADEYTKDTAMRIAQKVVGRKEEEE